jgi:hypothetical protein
VDEDELYTALDWLLERQPQIEAALAQIKQGPFLDLAVLNFPLFTLSRA